MRKEEFLVRQVKCRKFIFECGLVDVSRNYSFDCLAVSLKFEVVRGCDADKRRDEDVGLSDDHDLIVGLRNGILVPGSTPAVIASIGRRISYRRLQCEAVIAYG